MTKLEIFKDAAHEWRWRVKAGNGEIVANGEAYTRRKDACRDACANVSRGRAA